MALPKHSAISWDWKSAPTKEELQAALKPFGVVVHDDPRTVGSDSYGYIFSDRKLSSQELREIAAEDD